MNWDKVCCTKANGGLGIRKQNTFGSSLSAVYWKKKNARLQSDNRLQIHQEMDLLLLHLWFRESMLLACHPKRGIPLIGNRHYLKPSSWLFRLRRLIELSTWTRHPILLFEALFPWGKRNKALAVEPSYCPKTLIGSIKRIAYVLRGMESPCFSPLSTKAFWFDQTVSNFHFQMGTHIDPLGYTVSVQSEIHYSYQGVFSLPYSFIHTCIRSEFLKVKVVAEFRFFIRIRTRLSSTPILSHLNEWLFSKKD